MCVCVYIYMYVYICIHTYIQMHIHTYIHTYIHIHIYTYIYRRPRWAPPCSALHLLDEEASAAMGAAARGEGVTLWVWRGVARVARAAACVSRSIPLLACCAPGGVTLWVCGGVARAAACVSRNIPLLACCEGRGAMDTLLLCVVGADSLTCSSEAALTQH